MLKTITALKARQHLGQVMNEVSIKDDDYIVERAGKPLVAIIPIKRYWQLQEEKEGAKKDFFEWVKEVRERSKDMDPKVIEKEIEEAVLAAKEQELEELKQKG